MVKAVWKGVVIAESDDVVVLEGNAYFKLSDVNKDYLVKSDSHTTCPWKGVASYYSVRVGDDINKDAAWVYEDPSDEAKEIKGRISFWKGVEIIN